MRSRLCDLGYQIPFPEPLPTFPQNNEPQPTAQTSYGRPIRGVRTLRLAKHFPSAAVCQGVALTVHIIGLWTNKVAGYYVVISQWTIGHGQCFHYSPNRQHNKKLCSHPGLEFWTYIIFIAKAITPTIFGPILQTSKRPFGRQRKLWPWPNY